MPPSTHPRPDAPSPPGALGGVIEAVRRGERSVREECEAAIARIDEADPAVNAVVVRMDEPARAAADEVDRRVAAGARPPLAGVVMTVKESFDVAGQPTTWGHERHRGHLADRDAEVVRRLREAGAVIVGKSNVPVDLGDWQSENPVYGRTANPHDPSRSPGGSSGGAAAAIAAGMTAAEYGSDIAGSIRSPASFCGVWGLKTTYGAVSMRGHAEPGRDGAPSALGVAGPLAAAPEDLSRLLDATAAVRLPPTRRASLAGARLAVLVDHPIGPVDAQTRAALMRVVDAAADAGARVVTPAWPDLASEHRDFLRILGIARARGAPRPGHEPAPLARWFDLMDAQERARRDWDEVFDAVDAVLAPATGVPAFPHDPEPDQRRRTIDIDGARTAFAGLFAWAGMASLAELPAAVAPIGWTAERLPIGMQVIGPRWRDHDVVRIAGLTVGALR